MSSCQLEPPKIECLREQLDRSVRKDRLFCNWVFQHVWVISASLTFAPNRWAA